jgi:hypothetical protein
MNNRVANVAMILALVLALLAPVAFASKGGGKGNPGGGGSGSSFTLVLLDSSDGLPHYGQQVTFDVSTTATTKPFVRVYCYQNGVRVYWASAGFYPGYPWPWAQNFTLSSSYWTGGPADCTADLYYTPNGRRFITLETLGFHVDA